MWGERPSGSVSAVLLCSCARGSAPERNVILTLEDILMFSRLFLRVRTLLLKYLPWSFLYTVIINNSVNAFY